MSRVRYAYTQTLIFFCNLKQLVGGHVPKDSYSIVNYRFWDSPKHPRMKLAENYIEFARLLHGSCNVLVVF